MKMDFTPSCAMHKEDLANAWGAGLFTFNEDEFKGTPLGVGDLASYYRQLAQHIGISGTHMMHLQMIWGPTISDLLLPPLPLSLNAQQILRTFEKKRHKLRGVRSACRA